MAGRQKPIDLKNLTDLERRMLEVLPGEPNGLAVWELADGLLDRRDPHARAEILLALQGIQAEVGPLFTRRGDDGFGRADVLLFGLRRADHARVAETFRRRRTAKS